MSSSKRTPLNAFSRSARDQAGPSRGRSRSVVAVLLVAASVASMFATVAVETVLAPAASATVSEPGSVTPGATTPDDASLMCAGGSITVSLDNSDNTPDFNHNVDHHPAYAWVYLNAGVATATVTATFSTPGNYGSYPLSLSGNGSNYGLLWYSYFHEIGTDHVTQSTFTTTNPVPAGYYQVSFGGYSQGFDSGTVAFQVSISTEAPCPPVDAKEIEGGCNSSAPHACDNQGSGGDPVQTMSGAFYEHGPSIGIPGRSTVPLAQGETYTSPRAAVDGPLGYGWASPMSTKLALNAPLVGQVTEVESSGAQTVFGATTGGSYTQNPRVVARLRQNAGPPVTYTLSRPGELLTFDAAGKLIAWQDRNGWILTLAYSGGNLSTVTDQQGRSLAFWWTGTHITSVTDPAGRSLLYGFNDGNGNLTDITDVVGGTWHYTYDATHRLTQIRAPKQVAANVTTKDVVNVYDASGRVTSQTDNRLTPARVTSFDYTTLAASGGVIVTDPKGNKRADYYTAGQRTKATFGYGTALAMTWDYTYDPATSGLATATITALGRTMVTNTYDRKGNLLSSTDARGRKTSAAGYNEFREPKTMTDNAGIVTTNTYDAYNGNLIKTCVPVTTTPPVPPATLDCSGVPVAQQRTTVLNLDPTITGQVNSKVDPNGKQWTYTYDAAGNRTAVAAPTVAGPVPNPTSTRTVDGIGRTTSTTSPLGYRAGLIADNAGRPTVAVDENGNATVDGFGRGPAIDPAPPLGLTEAPAQAWTPVTGTWSVRGGAAYLASQGGGSSTQNLTTITGPSTGTVSFTTPIAQNGLGVAFRVQDATHYWAVIPSGGTWVLMKASGAGPSQQKTTGIATAAGQRVAVTYTGTTVSIAINGAPVPAATATDSAYASASAVGLFATATGTGVVDDFVVRSGGGENDWFYDVNGNVASVIDADGHRTVHNYNDANQETSTGRADSSTVSTAYFPDGSLQTQTDGAGKTTSYTYDALGRLSTVIDPALRVTTYRYDSAGNLQSKQDHGGSCTGTVTGCTTFGWWEDGRPKTVTYSDGATPNITNIDYDAVGRRTVSTDSTATTATLAWNSVGELVSSTDRGSPTAYGYDLAGNQTTILYPGQTVPVTRVFDSNRRITSISDFSPTPLVTTFGYDANANLTSMTLPTTGTPTVATYNYDHANRLVDTGTTKSITVKQGATTDASYDYTRAPSGQLASSSGTLTNPTGTSPATTVWNETYGYDSLNQLTTVNAPATYAYDSANNLTALTSGAGQTYDPSGNNQLLHTDLILGGAPIADYGYDTRGNRTSKTPYSGGVPQTPLGYTYDQANRLTGLTGTASYTYNPDGLRGSKNVWTVVNNFVYDHTASKIIRYGNNSGTGCTFNSNYDKYIYGPDGLPFERINNTTVNGGPTGGCTGTATTTTAFLTHDKQGSTSVLLTASGAVSGTYTYTPYGSVATHYGTASTQFQYHGEWTDGETGFIYLRHRFYDPATGQFITRDPANAMTRAAYSYADNNPRNRSDPSGLGWSIPGTDYCIAVGEGDCDNSATQNWAGNVYAGAGNALTGGHGVDIAASLTGQGENFTACYGDSSSWAYRGGAVGGFVVMSVFAAGSAGGGAASDEALTLFHGSDIGSVTNIVEGGLDSAAAAEYGGDGSFYMTNSLSDAQIFATVNPAGGEPAVLGIRVAASAVEAFEGLPGAYTVTDWDAFNAAAEFFHV